jgi:hypothetical protein
LTPERLLFHVSGIPFTMDRRITVDWILDEFRPDAQVGRRNAYGSEIHWRLNRAKVRDFNANPRSPPRS